jgi:hypothetical protein
MPGESFYKYRDTCEMLPLEKKQSGGKLFSLPDLREGSVSRGNIQQQVLQLGHDAM